jgi:Predicted ATPase (AAA+ superfamily)
MIVRRDHYLNMLMDFKDEPLVKIITGMRRCGKSTLMEMFMNDLKETGISEKDIVYMNFEDPRNMHIKDGDMLLKEVMVATELKQGTYLFFDEIQDLIGWEKAINSMRYSGADVYITGSNAKLLVSDFSTYLSGRYVEIETYPLSFREYIRFFDDEKDMDRLLFDYMSCGGLPYVTLERKSERNTDMVLSAVFDTVFIKDVVEKNKIRDVTALRNVTKFIMKNIGNVTSTRSISNYITSKGGKMSPPTADAYLDHLESAYLIYRAQKYDLKRKEFLRTSNKFYVSDIGVGNNIAGYGDDDISGILENIVFMELLFRGKKVATGSINGNEIDFIVTNKDMRGYYQVTTEMLTPEIKERETRSLKMIDDNYPKTIVTLQRYPFKNIDGIRVVALVDFLLEEFQ